ncbi:MAG: NAD(P)-binding domain-containing protein, partial [Burkholderiaceae bacterium]
MSGQTIGFIGLGNMGRPMAEHLIAGGHALRVHARRAEAMQPLAALGRIECALAVRPEV